MRTHELIHAARHAALLVRLGRSPAEALGDLSTLVARGDDLAKAMGGYPPVCVALFTAAETAPQPAALLEALSHLLERADRVRRDLFDALLYPLLLLDLVLVQMICFAELVLPRAAEPLVQGAGLLQTLAGGHALALVAALGLFVLNVTALGGDAVEPLAAHLPFAGPLRAAADQALWLRSVGILVGAGVPLSDALRQAARVVQGGRVRRAVGGLAGQLERGRSLSDAIARQRGLDPLLTWAAEAGESREDMASALLEAADTLDARVDRGCALAVRRAQPWALALAGVVIAGGLVAFWGPFYTLTGAFQ